MRASKHTGIPLPVVFKPLGDIGALFRRGQTSLVCAAPGGGKSALATHLALFQKYPDGTPVPAMYFSADSDESTLGDRATAAIVNKDTTRVHNLLKAGDEETWSAQEDATSHIWMNFNPGPTIDNIANEVDSYCYSIGDYPHFIVIDNIMNVDAGGGGAMEMGNLYNAMESFNILARETQAHVMVLHHATGDYTNGDIPIPRSGIMGKIDKVPRLILTLYSSGENVMGICVVKNSNGPASATADPEWQRHIPWMPHQSWFGNTV